MANTTGASLNPIYDRLNNAPQYHPLQADTFSDWTMEAGDIVTVSRDGKSYKSPVHSSTMVWKGGAPMVRVNSTGNEKRDAVSKLSRNKFRKGSAGLRNSQNTYQAIITSYNEMSAGLVLASSSLSLYVANSYTQMKAGLGLTSSSAALYVDNKYNQMRAGLNLTSSSASLYVDNRYKQMRAGLDLTSSSAALYVDNKYNQMRAGLNLTSSSASLYVDNKYNQMKSGLDLTSSSASLYVDNKYNQMKSGLDLTSSSASLYVDNKYNQMKSGLDLTSSSASLYVDSKYNQMKAGLNLTSSSASLYVDNRYKQMKAGLDLTSSSASLYVDNKYNQMKAGLDLTSSSASLYVDNKYNQMKAGLNLTSSSASMYVDNRYKQMKAGLDLTSSSASLYVDNKYNQMKSGLDLTSSSASLYVDNKYNQLKSGLSLTSSSAALYVDNKYTQMSSGLKLSSSSAALYVDNKYNQMKSGLNLSSSSASLYVNNKYSQLVSGLDLTSSSAALYVNSKYNQMKAGLALTSSSAALYAETVQISGSRVYIDGNTTINDIVNITDRRAHFSTPIMVSGDIRAQSLTIRGANDSGTIDEHIIETMIAKASVSGNVLTLTTVKGQEITFSKATSLSGAWGSGSNTYTVTATQNGVTVGTDSVTPVVHVEVPSGSPSVSAKIHVATERSAGVYDDHGGTKIVYLASNNLTVSLKGSLIGGDVYAEKTLTDSNLTAGNIKDGVTIFGVTGTYEGGGDIPPSSHIQVSAPPSYSPAYSGGGTPLTTWKTIVQYAVQMKGYVYFDAWLTDNPDDKKRYYLDFTS